MGFAWNLEVIAQATSVKVSPGKIGKGQRALIIPRSERENALALRRASELRRQGGTVLTELDGRTLEECTQWTQDNYIERVLEIGDGEEVEHVSTGREADATFSPSQ